MGGARASAAELQVVTVGDIQERFLVPAYQRGYRWGDEQVTMLLGDLHDSINKAYCLQPIVIKKLPDGRAELVDGQQRITTLYLLYLFMQKEGYKKTGAPFSIEYATRSQSAEYLRELDPDRAEENIDFLHLDAAFRCIRDWFRGHGHKAELVATELFTHLGRRVVVIWYEAASDDDSTALFTRLNIGRIPLTNAELVKALLLGNFSDESAVENGKRFEMGAQWDLIERELRDPSLWAFLTNRPGEAYATRIQLLFELMADSGPRHDRFHTFFHFKRLIDEGRTPEAIWDDIHARFSMLKEWHDDRDLYHRIGFLIATSTRDDELTGLIRESEQVTKSEFEAGLVARIRRRLAVAADETESVDYEDDYSKCWRALLLFNVETTRTLRNSFERYPFHAHKSNNWSLEHIHAQNSDELSTKDEWESWLREHLRALRDLRVPMDRADAKVQLSADIEAALPAIDGETFLALSARVTEMFTNEDVADSLHGLENLALLPGDANSALGKAVFDVKRQRILKMDREGWYIPICTRRVFLKYYTEAGSQQLQFWSRQDRDAYIRAMFDVSTGVLTPYLTPADPNEDDDGTDVVS